MNKLIIFFFMIFSFVSSMAQNIDPERVTIITHTKKIELPEANRNFEKIKLETKETPAEPQKYVTEDVDLNVSKLPTKINIATIKAPTLPAFYGNYVKVGYGNYNTPYLEGFFNNKRSENLSYGLHVKHFSSSLGPVKYSGLSQNKADAYVKYFTKTYEVNAAAAYNRSRYNFYGFNHNLPVERDTLKQVFNTMTLNAGIKNLSSSKSDLNYNANFYYYNFSDFYKAKEDEYLSSLAVSYKIDKEKSFKTDAVLSISHRKDSSIVNRTFFQIKPAMLFNMEKFRVTAGLNVAYTNDTLLSSKLHIYPRVNIDVPLIENTLAAFAGMEGEMQKNTLRSFISQNPYLQSNIVLSHTNKTNEIYGGLKGNYSGLNYKARIGYANYKNLYFFNNSISDSSKFMVLYDRGNTTVLNLEGDLSYEVAETFRIGAKVNYYNYNTSTVEKPWHRPNFTSSLLASYNLYKKIYINADIYYISGLMGYNNISKKQVNLNSIVDVNLKVDYKFSSAFSAFLELNNILSKKYQQYLYYPVKGINVIGGVSYSF